MSCCTFCQVFDAFFILFGCDEFDFSLSISLMVDLLHWFFFPWFSRVSAAWSSCCSSCFHSWFHISCLLLFWSGFRTRVSSSRSCLARIPFITFFEEEFDRRRLSVSYIHFAKNWYIPLNYIDLHNFTTRRHIALFYRVQFRWHYFLDGSLCFLFAEEHDMLLIVSRYCKWGLIVDHFEFFAQDIHCFCCICAQYSSLLFSFDLFGVEIKVFFDAINPIIICGHLRWLYLLQGLSCQ